MKLTRETLSRIRREFFPENYQGAIAHLQACRETSSRIRGAILSLAGGNLAKLRAWVESANSDWRDVLGAQNDAANKRRRDLRKHDREVRQSKAAVDEETAFLDAMRRSPSDNAVRLVYADWLDERGDPRAEYVRLLCEWCRHADDELSDALVRRERELRNGLDAEWLARVRGLESVK